MIREIPRRYPAAPAVSPEGLWAYTLPRAMFPLKGGSPSRARYRLFVRGPLFTVLLIGQYLIKESAYTFKRTNQIG